MNSSFHFDTFLLQLQEATTQQQVLALLKQLEQQFATMAPEECQQISGPVSEKLSNRLYQLPW